jgi:hypothetical protein
MKGPHLLYGNPYIVDGAAENIRPLGRGYEETAGRGYKDTAPDVDIWFGKEAGQR